MSRGCNFNMRNEEGENNDNDQVLQEEAKNKGNKNGEREGDNEKPNIKGSNEAQNDINGNNAAVKISQKTEKNNDKVSQIPQNFTNQYENELAKLNYEKIKDSLKVIMKTKLNDGFVLKKITYDKFVITEKNKDFYKINVTGTMLIENDDSERHFLRYNIYLKQLSKEIYIAPAIDEVVFEKIK